MLYRVNYVISVNVETPVKVIVLWGHVERTLPSFSNAWKREFSAALIMFCAPRLLFLYKGAAKRSVNAIGPQVCHNLNKLLETYSIAKFNID